MGDVANILGIETPREAKELEFPPTVPTNTTAAETTNKPRTAVKIGNKFISSEKKARPWIWAPFSSSSRTDGLLLHHWVRSNVEYPDYPYARFDIHLDPVVYNDETEYHEHLHDPDWTKGETDQLLQMAKQFELRWPVIYDRWCTHYNYNDSIPKNRNIEDLQARYYSVAAILMQQRISNEASQEAHLLQTQTTEVLEQIPEDRASTDSLLIESAAAKAMGASDAQQQPFMRQLGTGSTNKPAFDLNYERARRAHLEILWKRTKEEDEEEARLRKELKEVESQLRKLKKSGIHIAAAKRSRPTISTETIQNAFSPPTPTAGTPYLQSARMVLPGNGVNKNLLLQMKEIMQEMRIPESPIPSKRVCDLYDSVRRDILSLLVLQKNLLQKEGLLQSKRLVVSKRGGAIKAPDEETLLGIEATPAATTIDPDAQTLAAVKPNGPNNNKGSKTPRSIASNKSGATTESRKGIPPVISTENSDGAQKVAASQGKQAKKPGAPKRKRKSVDNNSKSSTANAADAGETPSIPPVQSATDTTTNKTVGKKQKKTDKATSQS